jgi:hypothetical protein
MGWGWVLALANARAVSAAPLLRGVSRFPAVHRTLWETLKLCDGSEAVGQMAHLQLTHRHRPNRGPYRRDLRRLPQELRKNRRLRSLLILLLSARQFRRHQSRLGCRLNAGDVEWVERHGCRESAARTWMSVRRGPTERRRSEGTTTKESPSQELGHLVTWCLFK